MHVSYHSPEEEGNQLSWLGGSLIEEPDACSRMSWYMYIPSISKSMYIHLFLQFSSVSENVTGVNMPFSWAELSIWWRRLLTVVLHVCTCSTIHILHVVLIRQQQSPRFLHYSWFWTHQMWKDFSHWQIGVSSDLHTSFKKTATLTAPNPKTDPSLLLIW